MTQFSGIKRKDVLAEMAQTNHDLLVIGGGITGAGIALDAQTRGIKTALVEMQDFAAGTSSRSTKLVHGGLRYLKQFEVKMVAEVGKERAVVYENGPHVTTPEWMLLPFFEGGTFGKFTTSIGLKVYDFLAGVRKAERRKMLSKDETIIKEPILKREGLKGGGNYVEYRTDDARLTIEVMKKAVEEGVNAVNYAKVTGFIYQNGKIVGAKVEDQLSGKTYDIHAKKIVNAAGPWVDTLREKDKSRKGKKIHLTKGVHLVFDNKRFPLQQAIYFDTPDGRMVFAIPRDRKTYVGTTDTNYSGDIAHPRMTVEDREYILSAIDYMFPDVKVTKDDIESSWAGLRPLIHEEGKDPSEISRKDEVFHSESGLITIAGGKLTGYRKMAEMVVDEVASMLSKEGRGQFPSSKTKHMRISGGDVGGSDNFPGYVLEKTRIAPGYGLTYEQGRHLAKMYGSNSDRLFALTKKGRNDAKKYQLPLELTVQLLYAIEEEMAARPTDFFIRRTGDLFFAIDKVYEWKTGVVELMAEKLDWSDKEKAMHMEELEKELHDAVVAADDEKNKQMNAI